MIRKSLAVMALIAATAVGKKDKARRSKERDYQKHIAKFNKHWETSADYQQRLEIFIENDEKINARNAERAELYKDDPEVLPLKHNFTSDMTKDEFRAISSGFVRPTAEEAEEERLEFEEVPPVLSSGSLPLSYDHVAQGWMTPVRDQGDCGSCFAHAANTVFEGTIGAKTGNRYVGISAQQVIDCTARTKANKEIFGKVYYNYGC